MAAPSRITPVIKCANPECLGTMGSLRVYKGTGAGREHQRGSIVQTCSVCHWTKFHTAPYHLPDAEEFVNRFLRGQTMDGLVLRPNVPVPVTQLTQGVSTQPTPSTLCSNASCVTQSGSRSKGNQKCTENMCRKCCVFAYQQAAANRTGRRHCQPHAQPEVASEHTQALLPPAVGPTVLHAPPTQFQPPSTRPPILTTQDQLPPPRPPAPALQPIVHTPDQAQATSNRRSPSKSSQSLASKRYDNLSQSLPTAWALERQRATTERELLTDAKAQELALDHQSKRTVRFIIWFKDGLPPLRFSKYVQTYPRFQLSAFTELCAQLKLDVKSESQLDFYNGDWIIINLNEVITALKDCPGLNDEVEAQPLFRGVKRGPDGSLASTKPSKVQRMSDPKANGLQDDGMPEVIEITSAVTSTAVSTSKTVTEREWPRDFYFSELQSGLARLATAAATPGVFERDAFADIFGCKYVKTTVGKYKQMWKSIPEAQRNHLCNLGQCKEALFSAYLARSKRKSHQMPIPAQPAQSQSSRSSNTTRLDPQSRNLTPTLSAQPFPSLELPENVLRDSSPPLEFPTSPLSARPFPSLEPLEDGSRDLSPSLEFPDSPCSAPADSSDDYAMERDSALPALPDDLCDFCDEPLPALKSRTLLELRQQIEGRSWPAPNADNPHHRETHRFSDYIVYCARHRFERELMPLALSKGWPTRINFDDFDQRVLHLKPSLEALLSGVKSNYFFLKATRLSAMGTKRAYQVFADNSAGYFGEIGYSIAITLARLMFPEQELHARDFAPLQYNHLIEEVVLPEIFTQLVEEDMGCSREDAISTLHQSRSFGLQMHPLDEENDHLVHQATVRYRRKRIPIKVEEMPVQLSPHRCFIDLTVDD